MGARTARLGDAAPGQGGLGPAVISAVGACVRTRWSAVLLPGVLELHHADYTPGSPDLDRLVQLMDALSQIKVKDHPGPFKRAGLRANRPPFRTAS
jgi:hypothetical protein